jgi:single-stranded-DNA-specific exonuclease
VAGFNLHDALMACKQHTISCGGHAAAGGMKIAVDNLPAFTAAFNDYCRANVTDAHMEPALDVDAEVILPAVTESLVREFDLLAPFGNANPRPVLAARGVSVLGEPRVMKDAHLSFTVNQGGRGFRCIWWRRAEWAERLHGGMKLALAFTPKINDFNDRRSVELEIEDVRTEPG